MQVLDSLLNSLALIRFSSPCHVIIKRVSVILVVQWKLSGSIPELVKNLLGKLKPSRFLGLNIFYAKLLH